MSKTLVKILDKLNLLTSLSLVEKIELNKKSFNIPIIERLGYSNLFMSEPWMVRLLELVLPLGKGDFIDVGVNIGQTLLKLKSVSPEQNYIGFEPNPQCVFYTKRLIEENSFKNVKILPFGISSATEVGVLNFYVDSGIDSSASMIENFRPNEKKYREEYIPLYELNSLDEKIKPDSVSILKIDVEGAELEVIKGMRNEISKFKPIILMEILPVYKEENKDRLERQLELESIFKEESFTIYRVLKENDVLKGFKACPEIGIHSDINQSEYVIVPAEKNQNFLEAIKDFN